MAAFSTAMALVMIAQGIAGLQWSPASLQNNSMVYACATGTLSLPWNVTVAPGDTIVDISWFVSGSSQEMIAAVNHGNFFAMPAFANRVRYLANAGIELDHVGVSDTGYYSVEVVGRSAAGMLTNLKRSVTVPVADGLQTTDGQLHISEQEAEYDVSTDQFYVVLRCGSFPYPTPPAFGVTWETPSGQNRQSSGYDNGTFHLRLDVPVQGGVYTCRLPPVSSCANGNGSAVSTRVDKTEVRLLLMEARQAALDSKNRELEAANTDLVRQNNELQAALQGLQGELQNNTSALENRVRVLGEENHLLKVQQSSLKNDTSSLKNDTSSLENLVRVLGEENHLLKVQQSSLKNDTSSLKNDTSSLENLVRVLGEENHLLKVQQSSLKNDTSSLKNDTSSLENLVRVLGEENHLLKVQQGSLKNETSSLKNDTSSLENRFHALGVENQLLKLQQGSLKNDSSSLENRVRILGEENNLLKVQQGSLKNDTSSLENRVRILGEENHLLKVQQGSLKNDTSSLENRVHAQGVENQLLKLQLGSLQNNTSALENRVLVFGAENQLLEIQQSSLKNDTGLLENRLHVLRNRLNATEGLLTQTVSFHASLPLSSPVGVAKLSILVLPTVLRNHGDGYDNTTGVFTAPYSGTYCFLATAASDDAAPDSKVDLHLYVNGVFEARTGTKQGLRYQPATLQAVVALKAGETAHLHNVYHVQYWGYATYFSGFLVDHTPN